MMERNEIINTLLEGGSLTSPAPGYIILTPFGGQPFQVYDRLVTTMVKDGVLVRQEDAWVMRTAVRMNEGPETVDIQRLTRILERGWTIFTQEGWGHALIRVDDRVDEPVPGRWLMHMSDIGKVTSKWYDGTLVFSLIEDPRACVTLRFRSVIEKRHFMAALSDGWGENSVQLTWPTNQA